MKAWIISIAGICLISVVVDLVLPRGKTNGHIKNIFSYAIVLTVIMPLPSLIGRDFSLDVFFQKVEYQIQDEYIYNFNQIKLNEMVKNIEEDLNNDGFMGITISISANIFDKEMKIDAVYVDLYNLVISSDAKNIDIKTEVKSVVQKYILIEEEKIIYYEWKI